MAVNLTPGAIEKISTGKCKENDLKPVVQLFSIGYQTSSIDDKQWYLVLLSDGSFTWVGAIAYDIFVSNKLQKGSIVQLTKYQLLNDGDILIVDLNVIRGKCDIIGDPKRLEHNETPLMEESVPPLCNFISSRAASKTPKSNDRNSQSIFHPVKTMAANLTPGAITKISSGECSPANIKPVVQVLNIHKPVVNLSDGEKKERYFVELSDGLVSVGGMIAAHLNELVASNQLQKGSVVQLNEFVRTTLRGRAIVVVIEVHVILAKCDIIGDPKPYSRKKTSSIEKPAPLVDTGLSNPKEDHADVDPKQHLTSGAITKIMTGECTENDLKPVLQVIYTDSRMTGTIIDNKRWYFVALSDGSFWEFGFITKKLQEGSIVQLTKYRFIKDEMRSAIWVSDCNLLHSKCGLIGYPKQYPRNETPLVERTAPTIPDEDHVDSHLNEDTDDSHHVEEPPTSKQKPSGSTQKCYSYCLTQNKKRKRQLSNDNISAVLKDISKIARTMMEKNKEDGVDACFKKLEELKEDVSKLTRMMMDKNKEDEVGSCFKKLETLEEDVSKLTKMMERKKEDVAGFKKLETLEQDFFNMMRMTMEKNKDVGSCKRLETLEEDVSKLTRMMMEKNKEDVMGFKKLETLEKDVSKMTELMMDKSKEVDAGFKKLETLEENVSKMTKLMMDKNKEDDVGSCFNKLEALGEDVSEMSRMMMKICKEDDMGACIRKLEKIGWGAQDSMYDTALLLFGQSADYRNLWLHLKPESCGNWVKNAGSMFGLLD